MVGIVRLAPLATAGLQLRYHMVQKPCCGWRLYLVRNTLFIGLVLCELLRQPDQTNLEIFR
jgi:hypothetical protein